MTLRKAKLNKNLRDDGEDGDRDQKGNKDKDEKSTMKAALRLK
jgi:hypothetical protein